MIPAASSAAMETLPPPPPHQADTEMLPPPPPHQADTETLPPPPPLPANGFIPQRLFTPADPVETTRSPSPDPLVDMLGLGGSADDSWSPREADPMCMEMDAIMTASTLEPLTFSPAESQVLAGPICAAPDMGPSAGAGPSLLGQALAEQNQPMTNNMVSVTSQVSNLQLADVTGATDAALQELFTAAPSSILGTTPPSPGIPSRAVCPPPVTPRRSLRQAGLQCSVPVAQRAAVRVARELKVIGPADNSADKAAAAVTERLKVPLTGTDLDGLAILTRIDREAIFRAASQAEAESAAAAAH